jgi:lysophospholipase L1-like esterase
MFYSCDDNSSGPEEAADDSALPAIDVTWNENSSIVCFGTSLTFGHVPSGPVTGSSNQASFDISGYNIAMDYPDTSYPNLVGQKLKIKVYNQGYVGCRTDQGLALVYDSVLSKNPALVLLEFGANDFFQHVPAAQMEANLDSLIKVLQSGGAKVALLSFVNPEMTAFIGSVEDYTVEEALAYYNALENAAKNNGIPFMNYLLKGIWARYDLMTPGEVHPNTKGYAQMAENVFEAFKPTFEKNGMIK